jgi:hypothetical protein
VSEWRRVPDFADYEVSDDGQVRRATPGKATRIGRLLRTPIDSEGYPTVNIGGGPKRVHVLVAAAFLNLQPGEEVHHVSEDRSDPRVGNLEVKASHLQHFESHRRVALDRRRHGEGNPVVHCACQCGQEFPKFDRSGRPRRYVSGHNVGRNHAGQFVALVERG